MAVALQAFLEQLLEDGRVRLPGGEEPTAEEWSSVQPLLVELERRVRLALPGAPPPMDPAAATWALRMLHHGCRCMAFRQIGAEEVTRGLSEPCPADPSSPRTHFSVDLALRWLPDLLALAKGVAPADPLVVGLLGLARAWPLSSVGVPGLGGLSPLAFLDEPSLEGLYVDRIIARDDRGRLASPRVREAVRAALGAHLELAPGLAEALERYEEAAV